MMADDLLELSRELLVREAGRPKQASLRRAVSTAYYAVFHALTHECINQTVGWSFKSQAYWEVVAPLYRAVDHASAKKLFVRLIGDASSTPELKQLGRSFVDLQDQRLLADYHPKPQFARGTASQLVAQAETAVALLRALSDDAKRLLAAQLLGKSR